MKIRLKMIKFKFFCFMLGTLVVYLILLYTYLDGKLLSRDNIIVNLKYVVVHLDLKGAPPKLKYLESILPLFKKYGVNGLLMEYEDMFPYVGNLVNISSRTRYDRGELKNFLIQAKEHDLEVIPLVQTFGHMEHVLKLKEFQHLREVIDYPDSICPNNHNSIRLIKDMLEQVISFHKVVAPVKHIHIGCDEVFHINKCRKCIKKNMKKSDIFCDHVINVKKIIKLISPRTTVLVWDDMIRGTVISQWSSLKLVTMQVEPVYWDYTTDIKDVSDLNLYLYHKKFPNVWISTAFKGADGRQAILPVYKNRIENHYSWMTLVANHFYKGMNKYNFKGIIITGWSRYSHMDPLCELLPPSLTSLIVNLLIIRKFQNGITIADTYRYSQDFFERYIAKEFRHEFNCATDIDLDNFTEAIDYCDIENKDLVKSLKVYRYLTQNINVFTISEISDMSSFEYYMKIKHFNLNNVNISIEWCISVLKELTSWEGKMRRALSKYYDEFVIDEFIGYKIELMKKKVNRTLKMLEDYRQTRTWDRRPEKFTITLN